MISQLVEWSNDPLDDEKAEISVPDVQRYLACILAMSLQPEINIKDYWNDTDTDFTAARRFTQKIGMSYKKFSEVRKRLTVGPKQDVSKTFDLSPS